MKTSHQGLTCVFGETDGQGRLLDLFSKQIFLVEEEDDGGVDEELIVTDGVKEHERLMHAVLHKNKCKREVGVTIQCRQQAKLGFGATESFHPAWKNVLTLQ